MKAKLSIVLFLLIFFATPFAKASVVEENEMARAVSDVDKDTLLIFDIDNTIIEPMQTLGCDTWFYYMVDKFVAADMDKKTAIEKAEALWNRVHEITEVKPVEKDTPALIRKFQENGIKVIALTARPIVQTEVTVRQLASVGVDFSYNALYGKELFLGSRQNRGRYYKGIIFVGEGNDKGVVLNEFLKRIKYVPKKVVFVDDRVKNVKAVDKALDEKEVFCRCVRYGAADKQITEFDPAIADLQFNFFEKILTDKAARAILTHSSP